MKKKIVSMVISLMPALIWLLWYLRMTLIVNDMYLERGGDFFILLSVIFIIFNTLYTKNIKWYWLTGVIFLIANGFGSYLARIGYHSTIAENPMLRYIIQDETLAMVTITAIVMLLCSFVKVNVKFYEMLFKNRK